MKLVQLFSTSQFSPRPPIEKHATNNFEIIKAIIDENENPETMCGTGRTVDVGLVNYVVYIPSQFNTRHDPVFLSVCRWYV